MTDETHAQKLARLRARKRAAAAYWADAADAADARAAWDTYVAAHDALTTALKEGP